MLRVRDREAPIRSGFVGREAWVFPMAKSDRTVPSRVSPLQTLTRVLRRSARLAIPTSLAALAFAAQPLAAAPNKAATVSEQVFTVGFNKIAEVYLEAVSFDRLGVDGLKGLTAIDPAVKIERANTTVRLYVSGALAAEYGAPNAGDSAGWAILTTRVMDPPASIPPSWLRRRRSGFIRSCSTA
jgi:carboxyl-terminal processing protease